MLKPKCEVPDTESPNDDPSLWEPIHAEPTQTTTDALDLLRAWFATSMVLVFNVWGAADLLVGFYQGLLGVRVDPASLGAGYFIPTVVVPPLLVTHGLIFWLLLRKPSRFSPRRPAQRRSSSNNSGSSIPSRHSFHASTPCRMIWRSFSSDICEMVLPMSHDGVLSEKQNVTNCQVSKQSDFVTFGVDQVLKRSSGSR